MKVGDLVRLRDNKKFIGVIKSRYLIRRAWIIHWFDGHNTWENEYDLQKMTCEGLNNEDGQFGTKQWIHWCRSWTHGGIKLSMGDLVVR